MKVFDTFMKVLKTKLFSVMIYVVVFLALSIPMAKNGSAEKKFEKSSLNICVFDNDDTPESHALVEFIGKENEIIPEYTNEDDILDLLYYESVDFALIIDKGYSEKLASGETSDIFRYYKVHDSYSTVYVRQLLDRYVNSVQAYMAGGMELSEAIDHSAEAMSQEVEVSMADFTGKSGNSDFPTSFGAYFRYMPYIMLSTVISALCIVLKAMNRKDIRYRTNCSSMRPNSFTMQIFAGSAVFVLGLWLILMGAGIVMYGGIFRGRVWGAVLNSFLFIIISAAIAVFAANFSPSNTVVNLITQVVSLGMSFLCGIFVPLGMLGSNIEKAARFLPAYWYVKANEMLCGNQAYDAGKVAMCMLVEAGFAVALIMITLVLNHLKFSKASESVAVPVQA